MKKTMFLFLIFALMMFLMVGNVSAQTTLVFASAYAEDDHQTQSLIKFGELVEEKTDGEIIVEVNYGGVLGGERDVAENIQLGSIDGAILGGILQNFDPALSILEFPFLFKNPEHIKAVTNGPIGEVINERMQENINMRYLDIVMRTSRQLTTNKPVNSVEDLQGLKIRVPEMKAHLETWSAMGASPTPMAFPEVYTALQVGTVDGQENPVPVIYANKFYEVCDYLAYTNHLPGFMMIVINDDTYRSMSYEHRIALQQASHEASLYNEEILAESMEAIEAELHEKMEVTRPDTSEFAAAAGDVYKEFDNVEGFTELYLAIKELGEDY